MFNRAYLAAGVFAALAPLPTALALAADVTVTDAKIAGGKLVVTGTAAPNTWVRLDGQTARDFNVKSGADGAFAFGVVYHPGDCIVDLQKLVSPTALGAATAALVADCGPAGVSPRGAWNATTGYVANDLVTYLGSTWRARRGNANTLPVSGVVWEQFAAAGEPRPEGSEDGAEIETADTGGISPAADTPIGPAGGDLTGNYPNPSIRAGVITGGHLAAGAVTLTKLADGAVSLTKLAINSVNSFRIQDGSITGVDIANSGITADDVALNTLTSAEIANNAIFSGEIGDESIQNVDIGAGAVRASEFFGISERQNQIQCAAGANCSTTVDCANDEDIISGGARGSLFGMALAQSQANGNGWLGATRNTTATNGTFFVYAYCLRNEPF